RTCWGEWQRQHQPSTPCYGARPRAGPAHLRADGGALPTIFRLGSHAHLMSWRPILTLVDSKKLLVESICSKVTGRAGFRVIGADEQPDEARLGVPNGIVAGCAG